MEPHCFESLLMADPTAVRNDRGSFAGKYGVWIGNMYANGSIKPGDVPELKSALVTIESTAPHWFSMKFVEHFLYFNFF